MVQRFTLAGCLLLVVLAFPAAAAANYDTFDSETLNPKDAFGQELPYTAAGDDFVASFDTSAYSLQPNEGGATGNLNGCVKDTGPTFYGRTGWVRFNPGVAGIITVTASTDYDGIVAIREANEHPLGTETFADFTGPQNCSAQVVGPGNESTSLVARADAVYYVQVGGQCPGDRTTCDQPDVPGGATTIRLSFTSFDSDGDGVPDTSDACPGGTAGAVTTDGCPDTDHDGIRDSDEGPGCVGQQGVAAPAPYNGCFDGPTPPTPDGAKLVIRSLSGNARNTSETKVDLELNWPKGTREAFADNGSGEGRKPIALQAKVPWDLDPASKSEARQVTVTYRGPAGDTTVTDIITLDPTPPKVSQYLLSAVPGHRWYLGVRARDDAGGSGVRRIEALDAKGHRIRTVTVCSADRCSLTADRGLQRIARKPSFVRLLDAAGNTRRKALAVRGRNCTIKVFGALYASRQICAQPGDRCSPKPWRWQDAVPKLKCTRSRGSSVYLVHKAAKH